MPHPTALFALSVLHCQRRLQISRVKNIGNVFELSGEAFRLAPLYGGFLVKRKARLMRKKTEHRISIVSRAILGLLE